MFKQPLRSPVIILGAHRSGTSIVTRLLEQLGMFVGARLDENAEALHFSRLNTWVLHCSGGRWDTPSCIEFLLADEPGVELAADYLQQRLSLISSLQYLGTANALRYGSVYQMPTAWGWKDPRNTITLPLWLKLFPNARLIHVVRNGIDVADSLYRRQMSGFQAGRERYYNLKWLIPLYAKEGWFGESPRVMMRRSGFDLWQEYLTYAERFTAPVESQVLELRYEDFVANPAEHLKRLAEFSRLETSAERIAAATAAVRRERSFSFASDPALYALWDQVRGTPWMKKYGYDEIKDGNKKQFAAPAKAETKTKRVLVLDEACNLQMLELKRGVYDAVICLFWAAPRTRYKLAESSGGQCFALEEIVRDQDAWERKAGELVQAICAEGPEYKGLHWRTYLAESLFHELLKLQLAMDTVAFLRELEPAKPLQADVVGDARLEQNLRLVLTQATNTISLQRLATATEKETERREPLMLQRLLQHWNEIKITGNWRLHALQLMAQLDSRYHIRAFVEKGLPMPQVAPGGLTLFSSYRNNSHTLNAIEPLLDGSVTWLLTNESARTGIAASSAPRYWLWQFTRSTLRTSREAVPEPKEFVAVQASPDDPTRAELLKTWLRSLSLWRTWIQVELPALAQLTRFWEDYLDRAQPRGVVMANQWALEGWLMAVARQRNIPVLQLMHGVISGAFYTETPIQSDELIVWGEFWRELFPEAERAKINVYTPPNLFKRVTRRASSTKRLLYFSWPLSSIPCYNATELTDGIAEVLHHLIQQGVQVTVRSHPGENPADFYDRWRQLYGEPPAALRFDKHTDLSELLAETDLALMFRSTVMLDCLVNQIPIVMPGWVEPAWNHRVAQVPGLHLASTFPEIEQQLCAWLEHPPQISSDMADYFVCTDATQANALRDWLKRAFATQLQSKAQA